jgi:hypothetical protein
MLLDGTTPGAQTKHDVAKLHQTGYEIVGPTIRFGYSKPQFRQKNISCRSSASITLRSEDGNQDCSLLHTSDFGIVPRSVFILLDAGRRKEGQWPACFVFH